WRLAARHLAGHLPGRTSQSGRRAHACRDDNGGIDELDQMRSRGDVLAKMSRSKTPAPGFRYTQTAKKTSQRLFSTDDGIKNPREVFLAQTIRSKPLARVFQQKQTAKKS